MIQITLNTRAYRNELGRRFTGIGIGFLGSIKSAIRSPAMLSGKGGDDCVSDPARISKWRSILVPDRSGTPSAVA